MENAMRVDIKGLKCDSSSCDYIDMSIKLEEYESYINSPCPKCGEPLLTQADFDQVQNILKMVSMVNSIPTPKEDYKEKAKISFEFNGTGNVKTKIEKYED